MDERVSQPAARQTNRQTSRQTDRHILGKSSYDNRQTNTNGHNN